MLVKIEATIVPNINDIRANASPANLDPFKYSHGLTGVDQPSNYHAAHVLAIAASTLVLLALLWRIFVNMQDYMRYVAAVPPFRRQGRLGRKIVACLALIKWRILYARVSTRWLNCKRSKNGTQDSATSVSYLQFYITAIYIIANVAYCTPGSLHPSPQQLAKVRGRCGTLATFNLILTILFALRNNPLIYILHVRYDTFNFFHRWVARLVVLESIAHVCVFALNAYRVTYKDYSGWGSVSWILEHSASYRAGLMAFVAFLLLAVHSVRTLRHASYDAFLTLHRIGAPLAISGLYFHLASHALPQLSWIYVIALLLTMELCIRISRILYYNFSWRHRVWTHVTLEALPGEATRVTMHLPRTWNATPGSHFYVYLPGVSLWSSHPFSAAWSDAQPTGYSRLDGEKIVCDGQDLESESTESTVSCIIRARRGMTRALFDHATTHPDSSLWGTIEGPYGGFRSLDSYETAVLFAAGVGITHQLPFVRHLLAGHISGTSVTKRIVLVWCIRDIEALCWVEPWLEELADLEDFREVVHVRLYVSGTMITRGFPSFLDVRRRRCDPQELLDGEVFERSGAMAVTVCGPAGFNDSVREAVRTTLRTRDVDFFEESLSY